MPTTAERAQAQALYLQELNAQAKIIYVRDKAKLPIDPQGRVLLEVKLDPNAWEKIYRTQKKINALAPLPADYNVNTFKQEFATLLGHPITATTSISYDIQTGSKEALDPLFKAKLDTSLVTVLRGKKKPEALSTEAAAKIELTKDKIIEHYQNLAKGRIISLQQETHFHAHLIGQMVRAAVDTAGRDAPFGPGKKDELFQKGLDNALLQLNDKIQSLQAKALVAAYKKNDKKPFDDEQFKKDLNKELDAARKKILPEIAKTVRVELIKATGIQFNKDITQHLTKELAKATSASMNDTVHISKGTGAISYIGASKKTSHHQQLGADYVADQTMYSHHLKEDGIVQALAHRQQVRVPALAVKTLHKFTEKLLDGDDKQLKKIEKAQEKAKKKDLEEPLLQMEPVDIDTRIANLAQEKGKALSGPEIEQIKEEYALMRAELDKGTKEKPVSREEAFDALIVADTAAKIGHLQSKYQLGDVDRGPTIPKAFVYNLYTSINRTGEAPTTMPHPAEWYDERNNKQTQSAIHILEAAHMYNRNRQAPDTPLCLVQNIPVNGWGHNISIKEDNPQVVNEAALMAQLAALHTVYDVLSPEDKVKTQAIFADYKEFLKTPGPSFYEYIKEQNTNTLTLLEQIKANPTLAAKPAPLAVDVDQPLVVVEESERRAKALEEHRGEFVDDAKYTMASLLKAQAFSDHDNGFTYQALSVFVENASIGGCKSANERAQAVNGRAAILDFVSLDKETRNELLTKYLSPEDATKLKVTADALETAIKERDLPNITQNMNTLYGSLNLEGFQALISFIDQGGHAKLSSKKAINYNTNAAEPVHTDVENASKWQCHKGLTDNVLAEFSGVKKFSWLKEMKNALTPVAAAVGATGIGLGIAAAVGVTAGFPPAGLILLAAAGVALLAYTLIKVLPKWWASREAATEHRFDAIQKENAQLIKDANPQHVQAEELEQVVDLEEQRGMRAALQQGRKAVDPAPDTDHGLEQDRDGLSMV